MTIVKLILQKCDRCYEERELDDEKRHQINGWREIKTNKHLCPNCIHAILEDTEN